MCLCFLFSYISRFPLLRLFVHLIFLFGLFCLHCPGQLDLDQNSYPLLVEHVLANSMNLLFNVTGEQPLKLAHSLLGYAVGMTDINRPGWPITREADTQK